MAIKSFTFAGKSFFAGDDEQEAPRGFASPRLGFGDQSENAGNVDMIGARKATDFEALIYNCRPTFSKKLPQDGRYATVSADGKPHQGFFDGVDIPKVKAPQEPQADQQALQDPNKTAAGTINVAHDGKMYIYNGSNWAHLDTNFGVLKRANE